MPRIVYIILFIIFAFIPIIVVYVGQIVMNLTQPATPPPATTTTSQPYTSHSYGRHHPSYWGGFVYYGNRGRGGWLNKSWGSSRSYTGGSSSFGGGGFGSFGK